MTPFSLFFILYISFSFLWLRLNTLVSKSREKGCLHLTHDLGENLNFSIFNIVLVIFLSYIPFIYCNMSLLFPVSSDLISRKGLTFANSCSVSIKIIRFFNLKAYLLVMLHLLICVWCTTLNCPTSMW